MHHKQQVRSGGTENVREGVQPFAATDEFGWPLDGAPHGPKRRQGPAELSEEALHRRLYVGPRQHVERNMADAESCAVAVDGVWRFVALERDPYGLFTPTTP
jgi:hypothetical protein